MDWFQESILLLVISTIGLGIIHGIEKIARILDHHFHSNGKDQMWILKLIAIGFFTGVGWGVADAYVVEPYIRPKEKVEAEK